MIEHILSIDVLLDYGDATFTMLYKPWLTPGNNVELVKTKVEVEYFRGN